MTPFGFTATVEAAGKTFQIGHGDKPVMVADAATPREIEQACLERAEAHGNVLTVRWHALSDYNL